MQMNRKREETSVNAKSWYGLYSRVEYAHPIRDRLEGFFLEEEIFLLPEKRTFDVKDIGIGSERESRKRE